MSQDNLFDNLGNTEELVNFIAKPKLSPENLEQKVYTLETLVNRFLSYLQIPKLSKEEYSFYTRLLSQAFDSLHSGNLALKTTWNQELQNYSYSSFGQGFFEIFDLKQAENYKTTKKPMVIILGLGANQVYLYFQKQWNSYITLSHSMQKFQTETTEDFVYTSNLMQVLQNSMNKNLNEEQEKAVLNALNTSFSIITGGPGTGKTTVASFILEAFFNQNPQARCILLAPTGRASSRLRESLEQNLKNPSLLNKIQTQILPIQTIHSFLLDTENIMRDKLGVDTEVYVDLSLIIIDEISMVSPSLFSRLISWISPATKVILLGDPHQLPSVEEGFLLGYFLDHQSLFYNKVFKLQQLVRSDSEELSHLIQSIQGHMQNSKTQDPSNFIEKNLKKIEKLEYFEALQNEKDSKFTKGVFWLEIEDEKEKTIEKILNIYIEKYTRILEDKTQSIEQIIKSYYKNQILTPVKSGSMGTEKINEYCFSVTSSKEKQIPILYQPIVVSKNQQHLGLFNGDLGIAGYKTASFLSSSGIKEYQNSQLRYKENCFAMTVHKSQGSEFKEIILFLPSYAISKVLSEDIFYTGISRAKERVILISLAKTLKEGLAYQSKRDNGLPLEKK